MWLEDSLKSKNNTSTKAPTTLNLYKDNIYRK